MTSPVMKRIGWKRTLITKLAMNTSAWMKVLAIASTIVPTAHKTTNPITTAMPRNRRLLLTNASLFDLYSPSRLQNKMLRFSSYLERLSFYCSSRFCSHKA